MQTIKTNIVSIVAFGFMVLPLSNAFAQETIPDFARDILSDQGIKNVDDGSRDGSSNATINGVSLERGEKRIFDDGQQRLQADGKALPLKNSKKSMNPQDIINKDSNIKTSAPLTNKNNKESFGSKLVSTGSASFIAISLLALTLIFWAVLRRNKA